MLVDIGFKEIEVGFPAASETEYKFHACRNRAQYDPGRCYRSGFNTGT